MATRRASVPPSVRLDWLYFPDTRTHRRLTHRCPSSSEPFSNLRAPKTCAQQMDRIREKKNLQTNVNAPSDWEPAANQRPPGQQLDRTLSTDELAPFQVVGLFRSSAADKRRIHGPAVLLHSIPTAVTIRRAPSTPIECKSMRRINKVTEPHRLCERPRSMRQSMAERWLLWPHSRHSSSCDLFK